ncbi:MAG: (d)CMP kinase [Oscillospiraceae bacterium]|nr:(d)CMP kinase [Oscillospiraceae bacterium]
MKQRHYSIAIDGPSGAGKSTLARQLAQKLGFLYVDTGAIYRTVGLHAKRSGLALERAEQVVPLLGSLHLDIAHGEDGLQHMYLNGEDVSEAIRQHDVSAWASAVSAVPAVRAFLLELQRDFARTNSVIMDGRDIGTVVLPQADVKVFLTAEPEERARRRYLELLERGQQADYGTVLKDLLERDQRDSTRAAAPLRRAEDALLVDTTGLNLEQSLALLLDTVEGKLAV